MASSRARTKFPNPVARRLRRLPWSRSLTVGGVTAAVVIGSATGVLAAPASAPTAEVAVNETLAPVLHGVATATGSGSESIHFSARTVGAGTWNLLDDVAVAGRDAYQALPGDQLSIGQPFEYQIAHCDDTGCTAAAVATGYVSSELAAGSRPGATRVPFTIGDKISAQVDVGTGNLFVSTTQLTLRRVAGSLDLGLAWNGLTLAPGSGFDSSVADAWRFSTGSDVRLASAGNGSVVYTGPNGITGTFTPDGAGGYTSPGTVKATLSTVTGGGWDLDMHESGDVYTFTAAGRLTQIADRNDNTTTFNYAYGRLSRIETEVGSYGARNVSVDSDGPTGRIEGLSQSPNGTPARSVDYVYDGTGRLTGIVDVLGRTTGFDYNTAGDLTSITAPGGAQTTFAYDSAHRVTSVTQPSDATGDAVTRLVYNAGQTLVADPNTDQGQAVAAVPHTTYDLTTDGWLLVDTVTDPTGAQRSATYTPFFDVASSTNTAGTTTFGYTANGGESLTGITSATGAGSSYTYGNAAPEQYLPDSGTDSQGNTSTYTYDGAGNALGTANAGGATADVTRNPDGTVDTATSPAGAVTGYTNDTTHQLTGITPPAGNSLGGRAYTYDPYGRIATYTSGRGITETYSYDAADRVTDIDFSDTTPSVAYTYDSAGRVQTRTDGSGVTTYTYDPLGRLATRVHTDSGGPLTYDYDLAGNLVTETDGSGVTSHAYDQRNLIASTTTPDARVIRYAHDDDGRRTDTWFATNPGNTTWAAHTHSDYDNSGRLTRVWTARTSNDTTRVSDLSYSYASPGSSSTCPTAPAAGDTGLRWSQTDNIAGRTTSYCYDTANRLTRAATPGGDTWEYAYDVNGNRTQTTMNGSTVQTQSVNSADQLTGGSWPGYGYDGAGNLTSAPGVTLTYNGSNQAATRSGSANGSYTFAGTTQNELISQTVPGGATYDYTWGRTDANDLPLLESFTNPNGTTYLWHDDGGSPLAMKTFGGAIVYYALDGLGSPVALINANGTHIASYSYDPYGQVTISNLTGNAATNLNPYRFAGGLNDRTTGYIKYGQRFYDPATGRFTQQDSIETLADPSRANRYEYAASNPINYVDPTGRDWLTDLACAGAAGGIAYLTQIYFVPVLNVAVVEYTLATGIICLGGYAGEAIVDWLF